MIQKAVILAGGKGTRLASVVQDKPKPLADINGLPFLHYLLLDLKKKGIKEVVLLVGHMKELIMDYFKEEYHQLKVSYEIESEPRGTGGFIAELSTKWKEPILLINGDTYFDVDIQAMYEQFSKSNAIQMAVKKVMNQDRYGVLEIENNRIVNFKVKSFIDKGFINGGIYLLPKGIFKNYALPYSFSLEKEFFEAYKDELFIEPFYSNGYFIDIGIPEDYELAQSSIPKMIFPKLDKSWSLFLDRDGVLNKHLPEDYVKTADEFQWINGSKEAVADFRSIFGRIVIVTNQQGIGKGLMTEYDLDKIHWKMQSDLEATGGHIDRVYHCPHRKEINSKCRKPKTGMAIQAKEDFPEIDFSKSIMIGDMSTDMEFGENLGMFNIKIGTTPSKKESLKFLDLRDFSLFLKT